MMATAMSAAAMQRASRRLSLGERRTGSDIFCGCYVIAALEDRPPRARARARARARQVVYVHVHVLVLVNGAGVTPGNAALQQARQNEIRNLLRLRPKLVVLLREHPRSDHLVENADDELPHQLRVDGAA